MIALLLNVGTLNASKDPAEKFNNLVKKFKKFDDQFDRFTMKSLKHPEKYDQHFEKLKMKFDQFVSKHDKLLTKLTNKIPELATPVSGTSIASSPPPDEVIVVNGNVIVLGPFVVTWTTGTYQGITEWSMKLTNTVAGEIIAITTGVFTGTVDGKSGTLAMYGAFAVTNMDNGFVLLGKVIISEGTGELLDLHGLIGFEEDFPNESKQISGMNFNL